MTLYHWLGLIGLLIIVAIGLFVWAAGKTTEAGIDGARQIRERRRGDEP